MLINPYSISGNGYISTDVLKEILRELDNKLTEEDLDNIVDEVDEDSSGTLDFDGKTIVFVAKKTQFSFFLCNTWNCKSSRFYYAGTGTIPLLTRFRGGWRLFLSQAKSCILTFYSHLSFSSTSSPAYPQCLVFPFWNFAWTSVTYLI